MALFRRKFTEPGAPPGVVVAASDGVPAELSLLTFDAEELEERTLGSASDLPELSGSGATRWIHVRGLGDGVLVQQLGRRLGLHPLAISDAINVGQRPKVDQYGHVLFVVLRMVTLGEDGRLQWEQVSLFLGPNFVLTIQETHDDCLDPLRNRIRGGRKRIRSSGADFLACMVIDAIVDGYFPVLEHYGERLEAFETQVLEEKRRDVLAELYLTRRDLSGFRRAIWPLREALSQLMRGDEYSLPECVRPHLRDTLDHTMQVVEVNESYREVSASLVDVHLSMVGQRTNDVMRVLTVVSAIFIPLTFVAGIYGMNFDTGSPSNLPELSWPLGYVFFWAVCAVIVSSLLTLFGRLGWFRR